MHSKFAGLELAVDQPQRLILLHPNTRQPLRNSETGEEAYIDLYSSDSAIARKHNFNVARRRLNTGARGQRIKITPEELEAEGIDLLAVLTVDWSLVTFDGQPLPVPFNTENAREFYQSAWVREQVDDFVTDRGNFPQPSSQS
jgi:hypothetical protein